MTTIQDSRSATRAAAPIQPAPAGTDPLNGHGRSDAHKSIAVEGHASPQARNPAHPIEGSPAGSTTAQPAKVTAAPKASPLAGHETSRGHPALDTHGASAPADSIPAGQTGSDTHRERACGEQPPPTRAMRGATPMSLPPGLAEYHLLGFAAKEVDDLESARVAAENRLRQVIRTVADKDGKERGFGLLPPNVCDEDDPKAVQKVIAAARKAQRRPSGWDPAVWHLAVITVQIAEAEKTAIRHLEKQVSALPLGPWLASMCGIGAKQAGRLLGAIGDPYIRPAIRHDDAPAEPPRVRSLGELYAYCGHGDPERKPVKGMTQAEAKRLGNPEAKKRVRVIAMQVTKFTGEPDKNGKPTPRSPYRDVYDKTREQYAGTVHAAECLNRSRINPNGCGIREHPEWGAPGSPWRDGHQHANALRLTGKAFLADLWHEAKRIHETCASGQASSELQARPAAGAQDDAVTP